VVQEENNKEVKVDLEGKVAIITGGGQGIGEGIVRCLAEEGADVSVVDINADTASKVADEVKSMGRRALPVIADLTSDNEVDRAVQDTLDSLGKIDILVNNVGGVSEETSEFMQEYGASLRDESLPAYMTYNSELWDRFYRLNLKAHVMVTHAVTPHFVKQQSGKIVNIASIAGRLADPTQMPYATFKAGVISMTWSLARALAPHNINVNCICPGLIYTPLWDRGATGMYQQIRDSIATGREAPERFRRFAAAFGEIDIEKITPKEFWLRFIVAPNVPLGREQTPEDIGRAVAFLVSENAKNITGQTLNVDGGQVMR
jgi:meso-butanediol dehydrogenase/(S,S)-butanediol dehydrogenase/diacetyl reductase